MHHQKNIAVGINGGSSKTLRLQDNSEANFYYYDKFNIGFPHQALQMYNIQANLISRDGPCNKELGHDYGWVLNWA
jgi:hypothetical protein